MDSHGKIEKALLSRNYALFAVRIAGYLPLSVTSNKLTFKWISISSLYTVTLLTLCVGCQIMFTFFYRNVTEIIMDYGPTERFAHYLLGVVLTVASITLKLTGLFEAKKLLSLWKGTVDLTEKIWSNSKNSVPNLETEGHDFLIKSRNSTRKVVLMTLAIALSHIIYMDGCLFGFHCCHYVDDNVLQGIHRFIYYTGTSIFSLTIFLHLGHAVWMSYFIQLYRLGFLFINGQLLNIVAEVKKTTYHPLDTFLANIQSPGVNSTVRLGWGSNDNVQSSENDSIFYIAKNKGVSSKRAARMTPENEERLKNCLDLYISLEVAIENFNRTYGVRLIVEVLICIVSMLTYAFFITMYIMRGKPEKILYIIGPFVTYVGQFTCFTATSGSMTSHAKTILRVMQSLPFSSLNKEMRMKLQMMAIRLSSNPPTISGSSYFVVNKTLVTSVVSALTTYLIVLVQFQFDSESKNALSAAANQTTLSR